MNLTRRQFSLIAGAAVNPLRAEDLRTVKARRKPNDDWHEYPTRTLDRVTGFQPFREAPKTDPYGGRLDRKQRATGFFYPVKLSGRWYLIDPAGNPYIQAGICSLAAGKSATNRKNIEAKFGTPENWAAQTSDLLRSDGFTGCGAWSDVSVLRSAPHRLVYCTTNNFMGDFGRSQHLTHQQAGHLGYANDFIPVFHPDFEAACDAAAQNLAVTKDDCFCWATFRIMNFPLHRICSTGPFASIPTTQVERRRRSGWPHASPASPTMTIARLSGDTSTTVTFKSPRPPSESTIPTTSAWVRACMDRSSNQSP